MKNSEKLIENYNIDKEKIAGDIINSDEYKKHRLYIDAGCYNGVKDHSSRFFLFCRIVVLLFSIMMTYLAVCKWIFISPFDPTSLLDIWTLLIYIICLSLSFFSFLVSFLLYRRKCSKKDFDEKIEKKKK